MTITAALVKQELKKQTLDEWLDQVDYGIFDNYVPSQFALMYLAFIKMVNGTEGEQNKTPVIHLMMLDKLVSGNRRVANLCFRGAAKTTLFFEYLVLYIAVMGGIPEFGNITGMIYVSDSMDNGVKSARKNIEYRYWNSEFLQHWLPPEGVKFTDAYIEFTSKEGHKLGVKMFGAKTGIRGTKIFGKRPTLAVLDDLVSDDDAKSKASMTAIKDTVYKGIDYALDPRKSMIVFNGTPFNLEDILIEAVESGAWDVNVWPVCEKFPCERHEFRGAWEDRFSYDYVKAQYDMSILTGKVEAFMQELMLRISSEENRLVQDHEILWYKRRELLDRKHNYNFYITTDFATSDKQSADDSVISVWAYNATGNWFWVDGIAAKQTMDKTIDKLFEFARIYKPQSVGIEVTGQQGGFIPWIQQEMVRRNTFFNLASSEKSGVPGIRPMQNKLSRFNMVVPWFKTQRMWFPEEMKTSSAVVGKMMTQIRLATSNGLKGKDDIIDTISMLAFLKPYAPSGDYDMGHNNDGGGIYDDPVEEAFVPIQRYV
jgi:predicted phage terminase large subunit-like protein